MKLTTDTEDEIDAIRNKIYEEIKDMTPGEEVAYFNAIAEEARRKYNFRHINKLKTKTLVPATNLLAGYRSIVIANPEEVIDHEMDD